MKHARRHPPISNCRPLRRSATGFTLVEILIVVMILGILAMIVVPGFTSATVEARQGALKDTLTRFRSQVTVYRVEHGAHPGYANGDATTTATEAIAVDQLTKFTSFAGAASATRDATYKYGPYFDQMPVNPVNGLRTLKLIAGASDVTADDADDSTGWIYQPATGRIYANLTTTDAAGRPLLGY